MKPATFDFFRRRLFIVTLVLLWTGILYGQHRIVSVSPTLTEIVYALGADNELVGITTFCESPEKVLEDKKAGRVRTVSDFNHTNYALIDSLKPDLILTDTDFQKKLTQELRAKGYNVLHYVPKSLDDVFASIEEIGAAVGKADFAKQLTAGYRSEIQAIYAKTKLLPKTKVYMEINHIGPWAVGKLSPLNDLMTYAGGENIFGDMDKGVFMTNNAEIVKRNPDVILSPIWLHAKLGGYDGITPLSEIYGRKDYEKTNAAMRSRVLYYDSALLKHEGPRQVLAIRKLAYLLHPDSFECPSGTIPWELGWIQ